MTAGTTQTVTDEVLAGYAGLGADWIARSDGLSCDEIYAPVTDLLPVEPGRVLDLGAATGRDAAWLAGRGHRIVAVEPVKELRDAGQQLHPLEPDAQAAALRRLAALLKPGGLLIASLRHGVGPSNRRAWPMDVEALVAVARASGLDLIRRIDKGSIQPENQDAGITWTWLALRRADYP